MPAHLPPVFHLLVKPTGATCNLACAYCFYLEKDSLYPGSRFRMSDKVLRAYIKQLLAAQKTSEVSISWQGGEPTLMGLDFFQRSVAMVRKYIRPNQRVTYTLQTNGTHLDDTWCAFFKKHNFLIGLSIDGPAELHNAFRVDKGGQGTFEQVMRGWNLLQKHQVDTNILCTVHAINAPNPLDVYCFFRDNMQARFIQFIPIVERTTAGNSSVSARSVGSEQFGHFLIDIFDEWVRHDVGTMFVQTFDSALASWCNIPVSVCVFQETCGLALVLEHNGDLYPCDHFVEPASRLGNILQSSMIELVTSSLQRQFGLDKRDRLPDFCRACDASFACHGECPRNRFIKTPDGKEDKLNYLCAGYKLFFHHIDQPMRQMANLFRQGRAPSEIMRNEVISY